jgi:hypothetical protein
MAADSSPSPQVTCQHLVLPAAAGVTRGKVVSERKLSWPSTRLLVPLILSNCRQERHLCYVWDGRAISTIYEKMNFG